MRYMKRLGRLVADLGVPLVAIGAALAAYRLGVMPTLENLLPASEPLITGLRRVGVVAAAFLAYWVVARTYEKRRPVELRLEPLPTALGAFSGAALIGITIVCLFALGYYQVVSFRATSAALPVVGTIVLVVMLEELVFRGVVYRLLERHAGTVAALVAQSLIFGILHLFNDGATAMTVVSVTLIGAFWGLVYVFSRSLWAVIANHAAWNTAIFISGVPLSGQEAWRLASPLESVARGPQLITGGSFGPEDSILNVLLMASAVGWLAHRACRRGRLVEGAWAARPEQSAATL